MGFDRFEDQLVYGYSTKHGGVSTGPYASMNLSFATGDDFENIRENFRIWCGALGVDPSATVMVGQTHTNNVIRVNEDNCGEGLIRARRQDVDGMVTDCPGVALVTSHADCVPLYYYDPVHRAIGLSHAGWRGTVAGMAAVTIRKMTDEFGSRPEDLYTRIGPCISQTYFECDRDVADAVMEMPVWDNGVCPPADICYYDEEKGKYHVSLSRLDRAVMLHEGVPADHIEMADTCTYEHEELYFSHRRQGMARGGQAALVMIRK